MCLARHHEDLVAARRVDVVISLIRRSKLLDQLFILRSAVAAASDRPQSNALSRTYGLPPQGMQYRRRGRRQGEVTEREAELLLAERSEPEDLELGGLLVLSVAQQLGQVDFFFVDSEQVLEAFDLHGLRVPQDSLRHLHGVERDTAEPVPALLCLQ